MQTPRMSLLLRERRKGLGMNGRADIVADSQAQNAHCWKFLDDNLKEMSVRPCTPAVMIKQGDRLVPNTEQQALFKRVRPLLLNYIQQHDETSAQKYGLRLRSAAKVFQVK